MTKPLSERIAELEASGTLTVGACVLIHEQQELLKMAKDTVEFYANPENYNNHALTEGGTLIVNSTNVELEGGEKAKETILVLEKAGL